MSSVQAPDEAYRELATYFRQHPEALGMSAGDLAERTGIARDLIAQVLDHAPTRKAHALAETTEKATSRLRWTGDAVLAAFMRATQRPVLFVVVSTVGMVGLLVAMTLLLRSVQLQLMGVLQVSIALATIIVQFGAYARHGRTRIALYGSLGFWCVIAPLLVASAVMSEGGGEVRLLVRASLALIASVSLTAVYAGMGVVCAILGGYFQVRRADQEKEKLTRQQLLERLFEVDERLRSGATETSKASILDRPWIQGLRRHVMAWAAVLGLASSLSMVVGVGGMQELLGDRTPNGWTFLVGTLFFGVLGYLVQISVSFLAGSPWRGVVASLIFAAIGLPTMYIPLGSFGPEFAKASYDNFGIVGNLVFAFVLGLISGLGALIEERAAQEAKLKRDDPAALLAEILEIQRKLNPVANTVCVMVVDAAKSSLMKAQADPLVAEWSFREYQRFIADISTRFAGKIHSTAGDGAVVYFSDCTRAFQAARTIQTEITKFNTDVSKLTSPFRLRIGLHSGAIAGDIEKVQFSEVIDIAAHVEAASQVGGICATEPVVQQLPDERFAALREEIDSFPVYIALNPTLGP